MGTRKSTLPETGSSSASRGAGKYGSPWPLQECDSLKHRNLALKAQNLALKDENAALKEKVEALQAQIEDAYTVATEGQPSPGWMNIRIMESLGYDFGDPEDLDRQWANFYAEKRQHEEGVMS